MFAAAIVLFMHYIVLIQSDYNFVFQFDNFLVSYFGSLVIPLLRYFILWADESSPSRRMPFCLVNISYYATQHTYFHSRINTGKSVSRYVLHIRLRVSYSTIQPELVL